MPDEDEVVGAICVIFRELNKLVEAGLPTIRINRICRETIFFLYEGGEASKWHFDRPHTAAARLLHREALASNQPFTNRRFPITYEHAIPLTTLRAGLMEAAVSVEAMRQFLRSHIAGVVVLKSENELLSLQRLHRTMPEGANTSDKMARYRAAGIAFEAADIERLNGGYPHP